MTYGSHETEVRELTLEPIGSREPVDELDLALTNVASATVDLDAAGLGDAGSIVLRITTDGIVDLHLTHDGGDHVTSVPAGEHTLTVDFD